MLLNENTNSLQQTLTKLVNKKVNEATSHIKRMIMSEDISENPAELYGEDGKIYYRRGGSEPVEVSGGEWVRDGTDIKIVSDVTGVNLNGHELKATDDNDLILEVPVGKSFIFRTV